MNIDKLEFLLQKVESATKFINSLRQNEEIYKQKIAQLTNSVDSLKKEKAELKDKISTLEQKLAKNESMNNAIEEKISYLLESMPDFDEITSNTIENENTLLNNNIEDTETTTKENNLNSMSNIEIPNKETKHDDSFTVISSLEKDTFSFDFSDPMHNNSMKDTDFDISQFQDNNIEEPDSTNEEPIDTTKNSPLIENSTTSAHFDDVEEDEEVFNNMFAFDDIIDNDQEETFDEEEFELPKGVM